MPKVAHRGAPEIDRLQPLARLNRLCWDDLRVLLACADASSFREAARVLGFSSSTVTRRIERLEGVLGISLFHRLPEGGVLTAPGELIVERARTMHELLCDIEHRRASLDTQARSEVTIAITEGLGSFWVMPRLVELQRQNPKIVINLLCAMASVDVLRLEADIAIQFSKPEHADVIATRLGKLHVYPFAAKAYLDTFGVPKGYDDMINHRLVEQVAPQLDNSALARYFGLETTDDVVGVRTNTSSAHLYAVEKGAGIGVLPTFAAALGAPVLPVDVGKGYSLDIWMTYHPKVKAARHKAAAVKWLREMFDPAVYPWFRDEFIHPSDLLKLMPNKAVVNNGRGFLAADPGPGRLEHTLQRAAQRRWV